MIRDGFSSEPSVFSVMSLSVLTNSTFTLSLRETSWILATKKDRDEGKDLCGRVHALDEWFHVRRSLSAVVETRSLHAVAISLVAIAVVHRPNNPGRHPFVPRRRGYYGFGGFDRRRDAPGCCCWIHSGYSGCFGQGSASQSSVSAAATCDCAGSADSAVGSILHSFVYL